MAAVAAFPLGPAGATREPPPRRQPSANVVPPRPARRGRRVAMAVVQLVIVLAMVGAGYLYLQLKVPEPPIQPPVQPPSGTRIEQIRRYVERYDGGECFFVTPIAVGEQRVTIEGLGAALQPFHGLDEAFQREIGFSPDIGVRQVTPPQCPAITLLGRLREDRARAPRLDLDKVALRSGETLSGTVERFGSRHIELLLVTDRGTVQNVSNLLKPGIDAKSFSIGLQQRPDATGSLPQLLVVVASPRPLQTLQSGQPAGADQLFPALLSEATRSGQTLGVTARYFRLDR
jgi:serine/threonine-protein kinase